MVYAWLQVWLGRSCVCVCMWVRVCLIMCVFVIRLVGRGVRVRVCVCVCVWHVCPLCTNSCFYRLIRTVRRIVTDWSVWMTGIDLCSVPRSIDPSIDWLSMRPLHVVVYHPYTSPVDTLLAVREAYATYMRPTKRVVVQEDNVTIIFVVIDLRLSHDERVTQCIPLIQA